MSDNYNKLYNNANQNNPINETSSENELPYIALIYPLLSNYKNYERMQSTVQCFSPEIDHFIYSASEDLPAHNVLSLLCYSLFGVKAMKGLGRNVLQYYMQFDKRYNLKEREILNTILSLQTPLKIHGKTSIITISKTTIESYGRKYYLNKPVGMNYDSIKNLVRNMQLDLNRDVRLMSDDDGKHYICVLTKKYPKFLYPDTEKIKNDYKRLEFTLGENIFGKVSIIDCGSETKHILISGGTGGGKSVIDSTFICICLLREIPFFTLDLKNGVEFSQYTNSRFCKGFGKDPITGLFVLMHIFSIVEARHIYFEQKGVDSYDSYMTKAEKMGWELIDPIVMVVDEWATFLELGSGLAKQILSSILNKARSSNVIIITSLQYASKTNLSQAVKVNFGNRIAVKCNDAETAEAIIDKNHIEAYTELYENKVKGKQKGLCYIKTPTIYEETKIYYFTNKLKEKLVKETTDESRVGYEKKYVQYATNWYKTNVEPRLLKDKKFDLTKMQIQTDIHGNILNIDDIANPKKVSKTYKHEVEQKEQKHIATEFNETSYKSQIYENKDYNPIDFGEKILPDKDFKIPELDVKSFLDDPQVLVGEQQGRPVPHTFSAEICNEEVSKTCNEPSIISTKTTQNPPLLIPKSVPTNFKYNELNQRKSKGR